MDFNSMFIDELIELRNEARLKKDWALSDLIREYLDSKGAFVFDKKDDCVVFHTNQFKTRKELNDYINNEIRSVSNMNAWNYSNISKEHKEKFKRSIDLEKKKMKSDPLYVFFN